MWRTPRQTSIVSSLVRPLAIGLLMTPMPAYVKAAENGTGFYLLGSRGPMAGFLPPPGVYLQNDVYHYSAKASASREFPFGGGIVAGINANVWLEMPTLLWSTPISILGGNLAFAITPPIGRVRTDVAARLSGPLGNVIAANLHDSTTTYGDPVLSTMIGWHYGNFHWQTGVAVNTPIGDYRKNALSNIAFNHWGADVFGAITWFDPGIGLSLSVATGVTFNAMNHYTQYRTGNEFHVEWAAEQNLSKQFSIGLIGYYYRQLTGDSGSGAMLGPFKGRAFALGGTMAFSFNVGQTPWSLRIKAYQELTVENRLKDASAFLTLSVPLHIAQTSAQK